MITPVELQSKVFKTTGMGYQKADVDSFFVEVRSSFEEIYRENMALKDKLNDMSENLSHYKEIEKSLQKALVLAETTAEETIVSARKNATVIEQEAVLKAESIVVDAKVEMEKINLQMAELLKKYESFKAQYKALASAQLEILDSEAFKIDLKASAAMDSLEKSASENSGKLVNAPVYDPQEAARPIFDHSDSDEEEEDFDETLSTEEAMIKDFSDIFDTEADV